MAKQDDNVQLEGVVIGGMTSGTVRTGGKEVESDESGKPVEEDE